MNEIAQLVLASEKLGGQSPRNLRVPEPGDYPYITRASAGL